MLLMLPALNTYADEPVRTVSLDEAISLAFQHHPRLKAATASVDRNKAARGEVWDGGSTSFSYSWGQLNGNYRKDNELAIEQSLGSLLTPFYRNALVRTQVTKSGLYRDMVKKEITAEVKRAWAYYQYAYYICELYKEQKTLAEQLNRTGELRYQQGDINLLERNTIKTMAADLHTRQMKAEEELKLASKRFIWACYAGEAIVPEDTTLNVFVVERQLSVVPSSVHLNYFANQVKEKKDMWHIEQSKFFPEFSIGYVRQKISPMCGLDSWMVGVSFPILFFPQHSRSKQAKLDWKIAEWEAEQNRTELNNKVEELQSLVLQNKKTLDYFTLAALKEAHALGQSALAQFRESEIDIVSFVQTLETARDIRQRYIEAVYAYNISALELELYTE